LRARAKLVSAGDKATLKLPEEELFEILRHAAVGSSEDHRRRRIASLGDLQKRIYSGCLHNEETARDILLEIAGKSGDSSPESSIIADSLSALMNKNDIHFRQVLIGLKASKEEEQRLFQVFSKLVLKLDYDKKKEAIGSLVDFLVNSDSVNRTGTREVFGCLVDLGNQKLGAEIVCVTAPKLDLVFETCSIFFSVQLCSRFAGPEVMEKMLNVLEKSLSGYYDGQSPVIEREICEYIKRVDGLEDSVPLLNLIKKRSSETLQYASEALATVLDENTACIDYVFEWLYEERDVNVINNVLRSFLEMKKQLKEPDLHKLLEKIRIEWWNNYPVRDTMPNLLEKSGEESKRILFEMIKHKEKYDLALSCLKKIGVSRDELSAIFSKPPMLQIYHHFYKDSKCSLEDLNKILKEEKPKLSDNLSGNTNRLEHLVFHILSSFNFVVLNVAPLKKLTVDVIGFYPETLDLLVIGCTTGTLKDDLAKMDEAVKKMRQEMPDLTKTLSTTPVVVVTSDASIFQTDEEYASRNDIIILQKADLDILLEMLATNRSPREATEYIKSRKFVLRAPQPF
jgi:hypothetical protein